MSEGNVQLIEKSEKGVGLVDFIIDRPCLTSKPKSNHTPLTWVRQTQYADRAIIVFDDDCVYFHLIELKSKLSQEDWITTKKQFDGMYLNALALRGLAEIPPYKSVTCHIAYKKVCISTQDATNTIFLKSPVGGRQTFGFIEEWRGSMLLIGREVMADLKKIQRDDMGNGISEILYN